MKKLKWRHDNLASISYNIAGAFELVLIKTGITTIDTQWDIEVLEGYSSRYGNQEELMEELKSQILDMKLKIAELESDLQSAHARIDDLETNDYYEQVEDSISSLESRVDDIESDMSNELEDVKSDIECIKEDLSQLEDNINDMILTGEAE